ncbi:MAG: OprO/OprP family phosphate-selective porin [Candidatus Nitrosoglobus sp.]
MPGFSNTLQDQDSIRQDKSKMLYDITKQDREQEISKQERQERKTKLSAITNTAPKNEASRKDSPGFTLGNLENIELGKNIRLGETGLEIKSDSGDFKLGIGGFGQGDAQVNFNDGSGSPNAAIQDGLLPRRARIRLDGILFKDFSYKIEYDFARVVGSPIAIGGITEAWLGYANFPFKPLTIKVGQMKEPLTLASSTSDRYLAFIERALFLNAFVENPNPYKLGISAESYGTRWSTRIALQTQNTGLGTAILDNTAYQAVGRVTFLPFYNGLTQFLHIGVSGGRTWMRNVFNSTTGKLESAPLSFSSQPFANVDRTPWANTGLLTTSLGPGHKALENFTRFGAELSLVSGPLSFQTEYMQTALAGIGYSGDDVLEGSYALVSYFLTGESRVYDNKIGAFTRVKPKHNFDLNGGWGAWEIAVRWDQLAMNTKNVNGGNTQTAAIAFNWYLNRHIRFMADYGVVVHESARKTNPAIARFNGLNPSILEFRAQIDW